MTRRRVLGLLGIFALVTSLVGAGLLGHRLADAGTPGDRSAEAGFARDMQVHHLQAMEMASIALERVEDPTLRTVAYDMLTTQQHQVGQMYAWLESWGLTPTGSEEPMAWVTRAPGHGQEHDRSGHTLLDDGRMPGMATAEELATLRSATGVDAEILFLRLMIDHHRGGLPMAEAVVAASDRPEVVRMAQGMLVAQQSEIDLMQSMLAERTD